MSILSPVFREPRRRSPAADSAVRNATRALEERIATLRTDADRLRALIAAAERDGGAAAAALDELRRTTARGPPPAGPLEALAVDAGAQARTRHDDGLAELDDLARRLAREHARLGEVREKGADLKAALTHVDAAVGAERRRALRMGREEEGRAATLAAEQAGAEAEEAALGRALAAEAGGHAAEAAALRALQALLQPLVVGSDLLAARALAFGADEPARSFAGAGAGWAGAEGNGGGGRADGRHGYGRAYGDGHSHGEYEQGAGADDPYGYARPGGAPTYPAYAVQPPLAQPPRFGLQYSAQAAATAPGAPWAQQQTPQAWAAQPQSPQTGPYWTDGPPPLPYAQTPLASPAAQPLPAAPAAGAYATPAGAARQAHQSSHRAHGAAQPAPGERPYPGAPPGWAQAQQQSQHWAPAEPTGARDFACARTPAAAAAAAASAGAMPAGYGAVGGGAGAYGGTPAPYAACAPAGLYGGTPAPGARARGAPGGDASAPPRSAETPAAAYAYGGAPYGVDASVPASYAQAVAPAGAAYGYEATPNGAPPYAARAAARQQQGAAAEAEAEAAYWEQLAAQAEARARVERAAEIDDDDDDDGDAGETAAARKTAAAAAARVWHARAAAAAESGDAMRALPRSGRASPRAAVSAASRSPPRASGWQPQGALQWARGDSTTVRASISVERPPWVPSPGRTAGGIDYAQWGSRGIVGNSL